MATAAQFQQLMAQVQQLQADLQAANQRIAAIPAAPAGQQPAAAQAAPAVPKIAKPEDYDGRPDSLEAFIHQCNLYLSVGTYTVRNKITFVLSYMKAGSALAWAESKLAEYSHEDPTTNPAIVAWSIAYADFLVELRAAFGDVSRQKTARLDIQTVKQLHGVDEYNVKFMSLFPLTGYNEITGIDMYRRGLKEGILRKIFAEPAEPVDFAAWRTRASHYDRVDRELKATLASRQPSAPSSSSKSRHIQTTASTYSTKVTTTPLPTTSTSAAPVKVKYETIEPSLAAYRKSNKLCIICGKAGHFANVCPDRKVVVPTNIHEHRDQRGGGRGRGPHGKKKQRTVNTIDTEEPKNASGSN